MFLAVDIGNVLCDVNFNEFIKELHDKNGFSEFEVWEMLEKVQPHHDLSIIKLGAYLKAEYGVDIDLYPNIMQAWNDSISPNKTSIRYLSAMLDAGVKVALLSNMGYEHRKIIKEVIGPAFDRCAQHISCDVGARKPQLLYYQSFLIAYPEFRGCVYVDDRSENLDTGTRMGFQSVHLDTSKNDAEGIAQAWDAIAQTVLNRPLYTVQEIK